MSAVATVIMFYSSGILLVLMLIIKKEKKRLFAFFNCFMMKTIRIRQFRNPDLRFLLL